MQTLTPTEVKILERIIKKLVGVPHNRRCKVSVVLAFNEDGNMGMYPDVSISYKGVKVSG